MTRTCVCFLTHRFDGAILPRLEKLVGDCEGARDVYVVAERGTAVPAEHARRSHLFDFTELRRRVRSVIGDSITPGNCHLRTLSFFEAFPHYEQYWFIEYDVFYDGDWNAFFDDFDDDPADLLGAHLRTLASEPGWYWSATFDPGGDEIGSEVRHIAFLPVSRLSDAAIDAVSQAVGRGWSGHFEMLVPTAVKHAGLAISDIGGDSKWTPRERKQRHYLGTGNAWESPALSTVRFRPPFFGVLPRLRDTLYHPDKGQRVGLADIRVAQRLYRQSVVGHPGRSLRYWGMMAARWLAQVRRRDQRSAAGAADRRSRAA